MATESQSSAMAEFPQKKFTLLFDEKGEWTLPTNVQIHIHDNFNSLLYTIVCAAGVTWKGGERAVLHSIALHGWKCWSFNCNNDACLNKSYKSLLTNQNSFYKTSMAIHRIQNNLEVGSLEASDSATPHYEVGCTKIAHMQVCKVKVCNHLSA